MRRWNLVRVAMVVAACALATALMAYFTEESSPLALAGWMIFFLAVQGTAFWGASSRELSCTRWLRRG